MRLDRLSARLRVRAPWEAVDFGQALLRRFAGPVYLAWFALVFPVYAACALLPVGWALLAAWWLRPWFDRLVVFVLSHALFGSVPRLGAVLAALPRLLVASLGRLSLLRLDPQRGYLLPAEQLEGLRGARLGKRVTTLRASADRPAATTTLFGPVLEFAVFLALVVLTLSILPEDWLDWQPVRIDDEDDLLLPMALSGSFGYVLLALHFVTTTIVEPAYAAAGFGLYLNRRTVAEGWDVELAFRRIAERGRGRRNRWAPAVVVVLLATTAPIPAQDLPRDPKAEVQRILAHPDFSVTEQRARARRVERRLGASDPWVGAGADALVLLGIAVAVAAVLWAMVRGRGQGPAAARDAAARPEIVAGLDLRPESLPADIAAAARALWAAGDRRGCLRLLYRGALVRLVDGWRVAIAASDTEGDCLRRARPVLPAERFGYLDALTRAWVSAAYGHSFPPDAEAAALCQGFAVLAAEAE